MHTHLTVRISPSSKVLPNVFVYTAFNNTHGFRASFSDMMIFNDDTSDPPGLSSYTVFIMLSSTYISNLDTFEYSKTIKRFKYWLFFF